MTPVLIVDDNQDYVHSLKASLERHNIKAIGANSGQEALRILEEDSSIVLVLLDVIMPEMNGLTVFRILRKKFPKLWVIFISGEVSGKWVEPLLEDGAISFLAKPFRTDQLLKVIQDAIKKTLRGT